MLLHQFLEQSVAPLAGQGRRWSLRRRAYTLRGRSTRLPRVSRAALQARGVRRGDRVAVFLDNGVETVVSVYAALKVGAVFMPINPLTKTDKLAYMLNDSRAACLVTHAALRGVWETRWRRTASVRTCIVVGRRDEPTPEDRFLPYGRRRADERRRLAVDPDDRPGPGRASSTPRARPASPRA